MISSLVPALISAFKARRELALENVALRQQLAVLRRSVKRPRLSKVDRGFWVLLRRIWTDWESVLVIVNPETVVRWHRCGFRRYWTWKSRRRRYAFYLFIRQLMGVGSQPCGAKYPGFCADSKGV